MSDNKEGTASTGGISSGDLEFLITCLQNTSAGTISVDTSAVAEIMKYKSTKSVANRVGALKKKYNLPFGTTKSLDGPGPTKKASNAAAPNEPAVPKTPSKARVNKTRAPSTASRKKAAVKVPKTVPNKAEETDNEDGDEVNDNDSLAVRSPAPSSIGDDEAVFGKKDDDEEEISDAET